MKAALALAVLIATSLPAVAIEGRYKIEGRNPGQTQVYRGEAAVKKSGETYSIVWQIGSGRQIGTGILTGSVLSVVFQAAGAPGSGGVASFQVNDHKITSGQWALTGGQTVGTEQWTFETGF
ncbi:hypothetical protein PMNALOAF_3614 [Methylobacterium adhaesivum]|jgi:hypothetical protein|uniref:Uncharacterized protein n=1 Tax=Methylobacterium adhaesivum TaxID=333297 RepID=A0ABT8BJX6_9HYPH|nr:hypothetical protein [Methylobacterium adhaesivum]MDN3592472.1 hypothetical protein [Methylobacterium adhaesivum]GJD32345.1 hypothetical protein PMNALOAF_3614 [Methylobacterium adhaesivum]